MESVFLAVALPFVAAGAIPPLSRLLGDRVGYVGAVVAAASFGLVASRVGTTGTHATAPLPGVPTREATRPKEAAATTAPT